MVEFTPEEFKEWLVSHSKKFRDYEAHEILELAEACGFDKEIIKAAVPSWYLNFITHSTYKLREDWNVQREIDFIQKRGNLDDQWYLLALKERFNQDFDDVANGD